VTESDEMDDAARMPSSGQQAPTEAAHGPTGTDTAACGSAVSGIAVSDIAGGTQRAALNVLGAGIGRVAAQPYPHVMLPEALAPALYAELEQSFPSLETILAGRKADAENAAVRLSAADVLANDKISSLWRDFFAFHGSADFWTAIVRVFGEEMRRAYPE